MKIIQRQRETRGDNPIRSAPLLLPMCAVASACVTDQFSGEQREVYLERHARCEDIARSLQPDQSAGGGISALGFALSGEGSVDKVNDVKDQYLTAMQGLLLSCREWEKFEITTDEWRLARVQFSRVYTSQIDADSMANGMQMLATAFADADARGMERSDAVQEELARLNNPKSAVSTEQLLSELQRMSKDIEVLVQRVSTLPPTGLTMSGATNPGPPPGAPTPAIDGVDDGRAGGGGVKEDVQSGASISDLKPTAVEAIPISGKRQPPELRLRFDTGSFALSQEMKADLETFLEGLQPHESQSGLLVFGSADVRGDEESNLILADKRARSVRALIGERAKTVQVASLGETMAFGPLEADNRLVVIQVASGHADWANVLGTGSNSSR